MSDLTLKKRVRLWIYAVLTALGVGAGTASRCAGCESGIVDDNPKSPTYGECISLE